MPGFGWMLIHTRSWVWAGDLEDLEPASGDLGDDGWAVEFGERSCSVSSSPSAPGFEGEIGSFSRTHPFHTWMGDYSPYAG